MKRYIKTALITSLVMLILMGAAGIFIGRTYLSNQKVEKEKKKEEIDMNLYGSSKVSIEGIEIYDLKTSGDGKNVETFSYSGTEAIYNVKKSAAVKEKLDELKKRNKYSVKTPLWVYNPFGTNKLSLYLYFKTGSPYSLKYTIHTEEDEIPDFTRNCYNKSGQLQKEHEYQITGLVPGVKNYIFLYLCNQKGEAEEQIVYSITPKIPKDAPQRKLSSMEGKSEEKLANGLYVFMGEDIYLYDNSGILRGMIPIENYHAVNMVFINGQMIYNYSKNQFATINSLGQVSKIYTMKKHQIYNDFVYDGYGNLLVISSNKKADTKGDRVVSLNLESGKSKELLNFGKLLSKMKKKASKADGEKKLNWIDLNSIVMTGSDSILVSSKELSSIIKVSNINSVRPAISYILAQDTVWTGSGYESLLYTKTAMEEGDKLFKSQFGQSSLHVVKDAASEQYYVTMLNHNYGNSKTRKDIKWFQIEGVGTNKKEASSSKYYEYLVTEGEASYMLTNNFSVPYSREGNLYSYNDHFIVNAQDEKMLGEYDKEGNLIRGLTYKKKSMLYKIQKHDMKSFWYD